MYMCHVKIIFEGIEGNVMSLIKNVFKSTVRFKCYNVKSLIYNVNFMLSMMGNRFLNEKWIEIHISSFSITELVC